MFENFSAFEIIFLAGLVIYAFFVQGPSRRRFRRSKIVQERTRPLDAALDFLAFIAWYLLPLFFIFTEWLDFANYRLPDWLGWCGVLIFLAANWLLWRAYTDLGRNWSPKIDLREEQTLVTGGVYRAIRHPIYAGLWLWAFAQPLLLQNWIAGLGLLAAFAPLYLIRVPREERMMLEQFGDDYRRYMARTGRIVPRLGGTRNG